MEMLRVKGGPKEVVGCQHMGIAGKVEDLESNGLLEDIPRLSIRATCPRPVSTADVQKLVRAPHFPKWMGL